MEALLGEGPAWCTRDQSLWFTDIKGRRVHRLDPASGARASFTVAGQPGFVLPASDGSMVLGMDQAIHTFRDAVVPGSATTVPMDARNRLNDATVDVHGRLWCGSMDDQEKASTGAVYRVERGQVRVMGGQCPITNGPAVSADGGTLYHVDTLARTVWRYRVDGDPLAGGEPFIHVAPADGYPDGVVLDAEGYLWLALWGGWCVRRYSPQGTLVQSVALPCANVTKVAFGGADLRTAFVTTARVGLSASELQAQPLAGGLFSFQSAVAGVALPQYLGAPPGA